MLETSCKPLQTKPINKTILCNGKKIDILEVEITGDEYAQCEQHSVNMWANSKTGQFGKGLINNISDPRKVERYGNFGEMAFAKIFNLPVDFSYKEGGDQQDFLLFGYSANIKNAARNYEAGLIRATTERGYELPLTNDIYVFAFTSAENKEFKKAVVSIVGYVLKKDILIRPKVPARKGNHKNYDIPYDELKPINNLYNLYWNKIKRPLSISV